MKTLPSASISPETNFQVWATMALVPDAIVLALGRLGRLGRLGVVCCPFGLCRAVERQEAGIDAAFFEESLHGDDLRADRRRERGRLLRDGRAAKHDHGGKQADQERADDHQPQDMRAADGAAEQVADRDEKDAEQHAGKQQEDRWRRVPYDREQCCEDDNSATAERDRSGKGTIGLYLACGRFGHARRLREAGPLLLNALT